MFQQTNDLTLKEKYQLYEESVQCPENDIEFINKQFQKIYNKRALSLREDFGGTGYLACLWAAQGPQHHSYAIDLDLEPIKYGKATHHSRLTGEQQSRVKYINGNVLDDFSFKTDITVAFNFSYFIFKKREELKNYFSKVLKSLNKEGAFFIDLFGGTEARAPMVEETEHDNFSYYWDCDRYNPITHECFYSIHFKNLKTGTKHEQVFSYDWRLWGIAELREILLDAGFSKTIPFWEGLDEEDGTGDGNFFVTEKAENCESWVTYIAALP